jgi:hypothetical protein
MYDQASPDFGDRIQQHIAAANRIVDGARAAGRVITGHERAQAEQHLESAKGLQTQRDLSAQLGGGGATPIASGGGAPLMQTLGETFTSSDSYRAIKDVGNRPERFSTGLVGMKGTLTEGPGGGAGALAATVPDVVPGYTPKLFRPLVLEDLFLSGQANTNSVRYVSQGTATSGAAGVAEAGTKPESTIGFVTADEPIKKIATFLPVSDETLEDAPAIQTVINGTLTLMVQLEAERQLLRGTSGGNEVQGILTSRSVPVRVTGTADGNMAIQLFKAMNSMRGSAFVEPDWLIIDPTDYEKLRLLTDSTGQLFGGGPFQGQYGNSSGQVNSGWMNGGAVDTLWNKPVYVSPLIGPGTALIGNRAAAQVWNRGGMRVEASSSHENFFRVNLIAIRAERRLGLTVFRSQGYCEVRGLA